MQRSSKCYTVDILKNETRNIEHEETAPTVRFPPRPLAAHGTRYPTWLGFLTVRGPAGRVYAYYSFNQTWFPRQPTRRGNSKLALLGHNQQANASNRNTKRWSALVGLGDAFLTHPSPKLGPHLGYTENPMFRLRFVFGQP